MGFFDDAANAVGDALSDGADAAADAAQAAADAAAAAAAAVAQAAADAAAAAAAAAEAAAEAAWKAAVAAGEQARAVAEHPAEHIVAAVNDVNQFIADHSSEIIAGAEIAGTVALYASGVGAPVAAIISGATVAGNEAAHGTDAGDALLDGLVAAADKLVPGAGSATRAVVEGIEHGEGAGQIAREAGLTGVGANGGPLLGYGATLADDLSHDRSAGRLALDLGSQYGNDASSAGTDHSNPLGQIVVAGANDVADDKSIAQFGVDVAKIYAHQAAGGDASPTAQLSDTVFDDIGQGKSLGQIGDDVLHQAIGMAERVEHAAPGALGDAVSDSDLPGSHYAATVVGDVLEGKTPDQIAIDLGKEAAGDAADQSGLSDTVKDLGIDTSALDPLKPYGETAFNDLVNGKSPDEIALDLVKQAAKDAGNEAGIDLGAGDKAAETLFNDLTHGKSVSDTAGDLVRQYAGDAAHAAGADTDAAQPALDAISHATDGTDSGDHPPGWPFTSTVSDVHHAVAGADATSSGELDMIELQSLVSQRQEAVQLTTQMMQDLEDTSKSIINDIGGGDSNGNGGSGDGNGSSDGDHPPGWPFTALAEEPHHAGAASQTDQATAQDTVDTPSFVSNLVNDTYGHIVQSSVERMSDADQNSSASDTSDHPPGWPFVAAADETHLAAVESDFWTEAAQAVNASSTTGQDAGNQMMSAQVAISSIGSATQLDTHSVSGDGPTEILSHDVSHDVASLEAPAIVNHVVAVPALEIVHATEFATHLHL